MFLQIIFWTIKKYPYIKAPPPSILKIFLKEQMLILFSISYSDNKKHFEIDYTYV